MIDSWIDTLCKRWEISNGRGSYVRSYRVYERAEFPEALSEFPCALTFVDNLDIAYSAGGPNVAIWSGMTEFHLFPNVNKSNYPAIMLYYERILTAAAADIQLSGLVSYFLLRSGTTGGPGIVGPVRLQYGGEDPHHGLVVYWRVKELVSLTVA